MKSNFLKNQKMSCVEELRNYYDKMTDKNTYGEWLLLYKDGDEIMVEGADDVMTLVLRKNELNLGNDDHILTCQEED